MRAGDERSHNLLTAVVIALLSSRKIQETGVWEDLPNRRSHRTHSRQIAGGISRVIAHTCPELLTHWEGSSLPSAETQEIIPPEMLAPLQSTLSQPPGAASSAHTPGRERQTPKSSRVGYEIADRPHPPPYTRDCPQLLATSRSPSPASSALAARVSRYSLLAPGLHVTEDPHKELRFAVDWWQQNWIQEEQNLTAAIEAKSQHSVKSWALQCLAEAEPHVRAGLSHVRLQACHVQTHFNSYLSTPRLKTQVKKCKKLKWAFSMRSWGQLAWGCHKAPRCFGGVATKRRSPLSLKHS